MILTSANPFRHAEIASIVSSLIKKKGTGWLSPFLSSTRMWYNANPDYHPYVPSN
jgi:hypothetical protein